MDPKEIKSPFQWWGKYEAMFPTIFGPQILGTKGSQIEIERIVSLVGILANLKRCHL
jgi:hypothetical protein